MRPDIRSHVRTYAEHLESLVDEWEIEDLLDEHGSSLVLTRRRKSNWGRGALVAGVTAAVIVAVGLAASFLFRGPETYDPLAPPVEQTATGLTTVATAGAIFSFAENDLCEWFTDTEITAIVDDAYRATGREVPPGPLVAAEVQESDQCVWLGDNPYGLETKVQLGAVLSGERGGYPPRYDDQPEDFAPHPSMSDGVRIGNLSEVIIPGYVPGVEVDILVDGHEEILWFVHWSPGFDGDHPEDLKTQNDEVGLVIANEMLQRMGWATR